jgi:CHAT domain-containing protein/tetratricopeptide (TPR) repeat protein
MSMRMATGRRLVLGGVVAVLAGSACFSQSIPNRRPAQAGARAEPRAAGSAPEAPNAASERAAAEVMRARLRLQRAMQSLDDGNEGEAIEAAKEYVARQNAFISEQKALVGLRGGMDRSSLQWIGFGLASLYSEISGLFVAHRRPDLGLPYLEQAILLLPAGDEDNPYRSMLVILHHQRAMCLAELGRFPQARQAAETALDQVRPERKAGLSELYLPLLLQLLAEVDASLGEPDRALGHLARARAALKNPESVRLRTTLPGFFDGAVLDGPLGFCEAAAGHWDEAARAYERALRFERKRDIARAGGRQRSESSPYTRGSRTWSGDSLRAGAQSLALKRPEDPLVVSLSAGWALNGKGFDQEAQGSLARLVQGARDPESRRLLDRWNGTRSELAAVALGSVSPADDPATRLRQLIVEERDLLWQLVDRPGTESARPAPAGSPGNGWVELNAVRAAIPADTRLIEVARFEVRTFGGPEAAGKAWDVPHYAAWVIPPAGAETISVVDLGPAADVDGAVQQVRAAIQPERDVLQVRGEPEAERGPIRGHLERLSRLVLQPLLPRLGAARRLVIAADAQLWLAPWAALPLPNGRYAVEDYSFRFVTTGRDLVAPRARAGSGPPAIFADPDFDARAAGVRADAGAGPVPAFSRVRFGRLSGTAEEARGVAPSLHEYAATEPQVFTGASAREEAVRALRSPRVLLFSTHGFALSRPEVLPVLELPYQSGGNGGVIQDSSPPSPLTHSGLVLSGANARLGAARLPGTADGLLTAYEIETLDLRGTELVVLSACDTGLGQVRDGEGVAGLRQAFQAAGARSVVATLWQVPDRESADLMADFFRRLSGGASAADALRQAQFAQIERRRGRFGAAHPFFWAAFTLTGEDRPRERPR